METVKTVSSATMERYAKTAAAYPDPFPAAKGVPMDYTVNQKAMNVCSVS